MPHLTNPLCHALRCLMLLLILCLEACSSPSTPPDALTRAPTASAVLVLGDSLSAGYQIDPKTGWVALLEKRLHQQSWIREDQYVVNASISGETSQGGLSRLHDLLDEHQPALVIIELGANDAMRRQPLSQLEANLNTIIQAAHRQKARVVLVGVDVGGRLWFLPTGDLVDVFERVAEEQSVPLATNILSDVNNTPEWMQQDGLHPNSGGQAQMLDNVWPAITKAVSD